MRCEAVQKERQGEIGRITHVRSGKKGYKVAGTKRTLVLGGAYFVRALCRT